MPIRSRAAKFALLAAVVGGAAATAYGFGVARNNHGHLHKEGPVYQFEVGAEAYHFDALWRVESLWRKGPDGWSRVEKPDAAHMESLRARFLARAERGSLQDIPAEGRENVEALKTLGYL